MQDAVLHWRRRGRLGRRVEWTMAVYEAVYHEARMTDRCRRVGKQRHRPRVDWRGFRRTVQRGLTADERCAAMRRGSGRTAADGCRCRRRHFWPAGDASLVS